MPPLKILPNKKTCAAVFDNCPGGRRSSPFVPLRSFRVFHQSRTAVYTTYCAVQIFEYTYSIYIRSDFVKQKGAKNGEYFWRDFRIKIVANVIFYMRPPTARAGISVFFYKIKSAFLLYKNVKKRLSPGEYFLPSIDYSARQ